VDLIGVHRHGDHWVWVGGPVPPGSDAITIGRVISVRSTATGDARLMRHEEEHVRQWRELGTVRFLYRYLGSYVGWRLRGHDHWDSYRRIPLEIEAERVARRDVPD